MAEPDLCIDTPRNHVGGCDSSLIHLCSQKNAEGWSLRNENVEKGTRVRRVHAGVKALKYTKVCDPCKASHRTVHNCRVILGHTAPEWSSEPKQTSTSPEDIVAHAVKLNTASVPLGRNRTAKKSAREACAILLC